jgi:hypothetical protein
MKIQHIETKNPIFIFELEDTIIENIRKDLKKESIRINKNDHEEKDVRSRLNKFTYGTQLNIHETNKKLVEYLIRKIKEICKTHYKIDDINFKSNTSGYFYYEKGGIIKRHRHFPVTFSATIYLSVDENSSPIIFETTEVKVKNNMCIIHPGILPHEVKATESPRELIVIDFMATEV